MAAEPYDVSVLIPALEAEHHIADAVLSARHRQGVRAQIVIAADDDRDYVALLGGLGVDIADIVQCRTGRRASGPARARNLAAARAAAPILATLDADDAYVPGRLAPLAAAARTHGAASGETVELLDGAVLRVGRPPAGAATFAVDDICRPRLPFAPVFRRELLADGWPDLAFAEDMVFNVALTVRAPAYAFVEGASYLYRRRPGSLSDDARSLARALRGYGQILRYLEEAPWPEAARASVRGAILEDVARAEAGMGGADGASATWRETVAAGGALAADLERE